MLKARFGAFVVIFLFSLLSYIYIHELTHKYIFHLFGIKSKITFDRETNSIVAVPLSGMENLSEEERFMLVDYQIQMDIIGYHFILLLILLNVYALFSIFVQDDKQFDRIEKEIKELEKQLEAIEPQKKAKEDKKEGRRK